MSAANSDRNKHGKLLAGVVKTQKASLKAGPVTLSPEEQKVFGLVSVTSNKELDGIREKHVTPFVVLKYYDADFECFSHWEGGELKNFSDFVRKISDSNWQAIFATGGKPGKKTGLGYTKLDLKTVSEKAKLRLQKVHASISPDINFFELRVSQEARVHGFRAGEAFFLVLLDKNHLVYPTA